MALIKEIPTKYGVGAKYWKITKLDLDVMLGRSSVMMFGWTSKEDRVAGKESIDHRHFEWNDSEYPFSTTELDKPVNNPIKVAYNKIKELNYAPESEFNLAVDD